MTHVVCFGLGAAYKYIRLLDGVKENEGRRLEMSGAAKTKEFEA